MNKKVDIYTDGACSGNPGPGGWGVLIEIDNENIELSGGDRETTNNRMELMAAIKALEEIDKDYEITLYTDSNYVKDGITSWISNWKKNNWKTASKKDVKNKELWMRLDEAIKDKNISWVWVKGHAGNAGNEQADYLARSALEKL
ncbi:MAG: ribonuclease HI [Pseudomonadota bacterium]|jgi:ribonuclease HI|nr:ribonuclease HI [Hyphomicrobiales bacterium]MEC7890339.1 ribonuclease HI [Pseudomonadota bacterium]|tara:strand:+ start:56 stop:490 length:435 start_codon:yes stop_codon:yes gene_type:complete